FSAKGVGIKKNSRVPSRVLRFFDPLMQSMDWGATRRRKATCTASGCC
ncbi:Os06g0186000, partial [Oryza sativa Japonica Group]